MAADVERVLGLLLQATAEVAPVDEVIEKLREMANEGETAAQKMNEMMGISSSAAKELKPELQDTNNGFQQILSTMTGLGVEQLDLIEKFTSVTAVIGLAVVAAEDYESALANLEIQTGATGEVLDQYGTTMSEMYTQSSESMSEWSSIMQYVIERRTDDIELVKQESEAIEGFAHVTGQSSAAASDSVTRMADAWNMSHSEMISSMDQLTKAQQTTGLQASETMSMFQRLAGPMQQMGLDFTDAVSVMALFAQAGITSRFAIQGIYTAMAYGEKTGEDFKTMLAELADEDTTATQATLMFGRAGVSLQEQLRSGAVDFNTLRASIADSEGAVNTADSTFESQLVPTLKLVWNNINELLSIVGTPLIAALQALAFIVKSVADALNTALAPVLEVVRSGIGEFITAIHNAPPELQLFAAAIGVVTLALVTQALALNAHPVFAFITAIMAVVVAIGALSNAFKGNDKELADYNAAMEDTSKASKQLADDMAATKKSMEITEPLKLANEYEALAGQTNQTNAMKKEEQRLLGELQKIAPDYVTTLNQTTGELGLQENAYHNLVSAQEGAMLSAIAKQQVDLDSAKTEYAATQATWDHIQALFSEAQASAEIDYQNKMKTWTPYTWSGGPEGALTANPVPVPDTSQVELYAKRLSEVGGAMGEYQDQIKAGTISVTDAQIAYDNFGQSLKDLQSQYLTDFQSAQDAGSAVSSSAKQMTDAVKEQLDFLDQALKQSITDEENAELASLDRRMDAYDKWVEISNNNDRIAVAERIKNMTYQMQQELAILDQGLQDQTDAYTAQKDELNAALKALDDNKNSEDEASYQESMKKKMAMASSTTDLDSLRAELEKHNRDLAYSQQKENLQQQLQDLTAAYDEKKKKLDAERQAVADDWKQRIELEQKNSDAMIAIRNAQATMVNKTIEDEKTAVKAKYDLMKSQEADFISYLTKSYDSDEVAFQGLLDTNLLKFQSYIDNLKILASQIPNFAANLPAPPTTTTMTPATTGASTISTTITGNEGAGGLIPSNIGQVLSGLYTQGAASYSALNAMQSQIRAASAMGITKVQNVTLNPNQERIQSPPILVMAPQPTPIQPLATAQTASSPKSEPARQIHATINVQPRPDAQQEALSIVNALVSEVYVKGRL